ncbi:DMT family transporter [Sphingomonas daechungensis]|uniref:DMT family transporter n=1 Tax=Sphingomonas daechungensis TaxID=1176646 RepID=UPI003783EA5D
MNRVAQHPVQAFAAALAAVGILSVMDAVMKALVLAIGIYAVSIWRSLAGLILAGALYLPRRLPWPSAATLKIHVFRGVIVTAMAFLFFWGIGRVPLAQAIALTFIAPLIAMMLAALFLHEKIGRKSIGGSLIAFGGVLVIVLGQARAELGPEVLLGTAAIIGSALCYAGNIVLMRHQALAAKPLEITFFQSLTIAVLWAMVLPFAGIPHLPSPTWGAWVVVAAAMSTAGALLFAWGYARAEASYLAATEYSAFIWASALGWLVFSEPVSFYTIAGAALIVGGCIVAARSKLKAPGEVEVAT